MKTINKYKLLVGILFLSLGSIITSCSGPKNMLVFSEYEVQCMGIGTQGSKLVKVFCYGKKSDMSDAIAEAKRNSVHAILFRGVSTGSSGCDQYGLATPDLLEKNKDFFTNFFKPGGQYLQYVNLSSDGSVSPNDRFKVGNRYKVGVVVSVSKDALRRDLENAGIIKKLGSGW